jgi:hypothetical protein
MNLVKRFSILEKRLFCLQVGIQELNHVLRISSRIEIIGISVLVFFNRPGLRTGRGVGQLCQVAIIDPVIGCAVDQVDWPW